MPNISSDSSAFLIAVQSCSIPNSASPSPLGRTLLSWVSGSQSAIILSVTANSTIVGSYRLCARWQPTSLYFDAGPFSIFTVSGVSPTSIPLSSWDLLLTISGANFMNMSSDPSAIILSPSSACDSSVALMKNLTTLSSQSIALTLNDASASVGTFMLCVRAAPSAQYSPTSVDVSIGQSLPHSAASPFHVFLTLRINMRVSVDYAMQVLSVPSDVNAPRSIPSPAWYAGLSYNVTISCTLPFQNANLAFKSASLSQDSTATLIASLQCPSG